MSTPIETVDLTAFTGVLVVAGGSAVTVALQLCGAVLRRHPKRGKARLVLCNHTKDRVRLGALANRSHRA